MKRKPPAETAGEPKPEHTPWARPPSLPRRGWWLLGAVILLVNLPLLHRSLLRGAPPSVVSFPYEDDFSSRAPLAERYWSSGGDWHVRDAELWNPGVVRNPLWLLGSLPEEVVITFEARAVESQGDVRVVVFGDGTDFQSGYELVHTLTTAYLQRLGDPAAPLRGPPSTLTSDARVRVEGQRVPLEPGTMQRWRIERRGQTLRWFIDGREVLSFADPYPLLGRGHDRFGFSGSDASSRFDRLWIGTPSEAPGLIPVAAAPERPAEPFADDFNREELGEEWRVTGPGTARLENGALVLENVRNRPVWSRRPLPDDAVIELTLWTDDPQGDLKFEAWGDGRSFHAGDPRAQYTATGYVFVFGGWRNTTTVIARGNEHAPDRAERSDLRVVPGKRYRMRVERKGGTLRWFIDGEQVLAFDDPAPLSGPDNRYLGLSGWQTRVHVDDLRVSAAP